MKRSLLTALAALGMAGSANAQGPNDVTAILGNLPNAVQTLTDGLANVGDTFSTTGSFEATHEALYVDVIVPSGAALVEGSPTLGSLAELGGTPIMLLSNPSYIPGVKVSRLLDDPSVETFQANVLGENDLALIASNLAQTPDSIYQGYSTVPFPGGPEIPLDGLAAYGLEPLLSDGSVVPLLEFIDGRSGQPGLYDNGLDQGLLAGTAFGDAETLFGGGDAWGRSLSRIPFLLGEAFGTADTFQSIDEATQPILMDTLVPVANQPLLGQPTLSEVVLSLETEPTIELLGYYDLVGAAGFSQ